jgi:hypothetical protein
VVCGCSGSGDFSCGGTGCCNQVCGNDRCFGTGCCNQRSDNHCRYHVESCYLHGDQDG